MIEFLRWSTSAASLLIMILLPGLALVALAERAGSKSRRWYVVWLAGLAGGTGIIYITSRLFGFSGTSALSASIVTGLFVPVLSRLRYRRIHLAPPAKTHVWATICVALVTVTIATAYVEFPMGSDFIATSVRDWNPRQAMIWSIRNLGLPLQDSLFYPGKSLPMYYSVGLYPLIAAAGQIGGATVPNAWPFTIVSAVTFLAVCLLAGDLAGRTFASRTAASWTSVFICVGGMDVLVNASLMLSGQPVSLGHVGAWAAGEQLRIDGLYVCALWAVPHLAAAAGALVILRWLPLDIRKRPMACLAAGLIIAGMFYLSPYVTVAAGAIIAANLAIQATRGRWKRWSTHALSLGCCGIIAAALVLVWVIDLQAADLSAGKSKLLLALPSASIHPVSRLVNNWVGRWLDLEVQMVLELAPVALLGLLGWVYCKPSRRWRLQGRILAVSFPVILVLALTVRSTGRINDWGVRVTHLLQMSAAILAGGLMARWKSWPAITRAVTCGFILLGASATVWQMGSANVGRFLVTTPNRRGELHEAAQYVDRSAAKDAIVMFDLGIEGGNYARRWSNRRALLSDLVHGSMSYTDQAKKDEVLSACRSVETDGLGVKQAQMLLRYGASVALVRTQLISDAPPAAVLYTNDAFAVVDLRSAAAAG